MNDFARVESRPKRKALAGWFVTYLRERSRKRLINKLQTQTKCRTRWAPRDVRRCAEACHVPERCVVPLFTSWHRLNTSRRHKWHKQQHKCALVLPYVCTYERGFLVARAASLLHVLNAL